ncbi:DUF4943 family protein [Algoriphagus sp. Y33]|uniref:DUF4943 family protein n=1 Tax=Algoriphagus sp. Y33 TaxID=2772483 RepID=UPI001786965A|nr:DUF4943 family protein [Algoriphagus sp. Y33]
MKAIRLPISIFLLLIFLGCEDKSEPPKMDVERYVNLLKAGDYDHWELPDFNSKDIPKLLSYRNETEIISDYPINALSSAWFPECSLGMYILWTVESIRARSIGSELLTRTFPSLNPFVKNRVDLEYLEQTAQLQQEVADSYFEWWESNKNKDFTEFDEIDPLADTEYRWH